MITKLHVKNFKCLRDVSVELKPFTVLIGKNDTGKTSLLEAVEALGGLVAEKPALALPVDKLAWNGVDPPWIEWMAEIAPTPRNRLPGAATYSLRISPPASRTAGPYYVEDEKVAVHGIDVAVGYRHAANGAVVSLADGASKQESNATSLAGPALWSARTQKGFPNLVAVAQALSGVEKYRLDPAQLHRPGSFGGGDEVPRLAADGAGLPLVIDYFLGAKRSSFDAIERELHEAVPFIKSIKLRPWRSNGHVGKMLSFELSSTGREISADVASDGVILFLAYLTLVHADEPPAVLLIEEPENGVHPRALQRIAAYLRGLTDPARGANAVQIITATHSPYFLDFVPPPRASSSSVPRRTARPSSPRCSTCQG
jgi:AAA domain, putative AbiEii toxin, Type IV TA system/AAA ATPase domain